jgi:hypothetical protein
MVKSGYCCGGDMWLSPLIAMSFSTCTCQLLWSTIVKQLKKIIHNGKGHFQL